MLQTFKAKQPSFQHSNEPVYTEIGKSNVKFIPPNINGGGFQLLKSFVLFYRT